MSVNPRGRVWRWFLKNLAHVDWYTEGCNLGWQNWWRFKARHLTHPILCGLGRKTVKLRSRDCPYALLARTGSSDPRVFQQVFAQRAFRVLDCLPPPRLVIDCGANVGYSSAYFLSRFPSARVIAVEPDPDNFAVLERNLAPFAGRVELYQTGVWSEPCGMAVAEPEPGEREWGRRVRACTPGEPAQFMAVTIESLLRASGADRIDLLKVDIEGAEAEIFTGGERPWLGRTDAIAIELHGDACRRAFGRAISHEGFVVTECGELTICRRPS